MTHITARSRLTSAEVSLSLTQVGGERQEQTVGAEQSESESRAGEFEKKAKKEISMQPSVEWRTYVCAWSTSKQNKHTLAQPIVCSPTSGPQYVGKCVTQEEEGEDRDRQNGRERYGDWLDSGRSRARREPKQRTTFFADFPTLPCVLA